MKVTFLGTGTSQGIPVPLCNCEICASNDPRDKRLRASLFVETGQKNILIDTSADFRQQMLRSSIRKIDLILLTHHHFDHLYGLDDIRSFTNAHQQFIDVYTKPDCIPEVMTRFGYAFHRDNLQIGLPALRMHAVVKPFFVGENNHKITITPVEVGHGRLGIYGYRIGNMAYLTDCKTIPDKSFDLLKNLDVLIIESLRYRLHPTHASLIESLAFIKKISPKRAYLTHFSHELKHSRLDAELPENVFPAHDMLELFIDEE
ncbi:beta-lactamase domain protein [Chloroherpeton thalassium ATCC 35110]|uniref:Beta-lactamase domain protein n=1 Tax=Chloroherpeton thalassium (strain ATCC 35110 / GB-78) TaxID=517418 RepID=B3QWC4_CHLT3|nr:MBL fold metallo-hydrolase [Chloroherpeton thalassium]ACF13237.1 beta-lactamase domain protein [Chloroherpeton thalassium ATCC 35110]